jgi:ABC-type sugar transport system ATPase subunit
MLCLNGVFFMDANALSMQGISKRFPGTLAVDGVDFEVRVGEVHALMGENGAGKSTLMKCLTGCFDDYTGEIGVNGKAVALHSPADAKAQGIGMVYQELSLARPINIAENLLAGRFPTTRMGLLDPKALQREARRCLLLVGLDIDPRKTVEEISPHEAQLVEIAKVLGNHPCILILDEPTSALSREEAQRLFEIIRALKRGGLAIIYISHHLPEVFEVADRVTVMRDGRKMSTHAVAEVTPETLVQKMVGQRVDEFYSERSAVIGPTLLQVERLTRLGFFHDVSFSLRRGEILGVVGLSGAGRSELARSLCGLDPVDFGAVTLDGETMPLEDYPGAVAKGLVYLSEDRKTEGLFLRLPVKTNLMAARLPLLSKWGFYAPGDAPSLVRTFMDELDIVAVSGEVDAGTLSGGNQQKVLLGKCLATDPEVLILDEPSRGVDVNAKRRIHRAVMKLADQGKSVLLISSDLPELVGLSDRAIVLRNGRLIGEMGKEEMSEESVLLAANGHGALCHG